MRGLHHLRLTPRHILIAPDGTIRVSGVAVAAATDGSGEQEPDAAQALRRDAMGLVAVLYAALTSRWPLRDQTSGIEPAPKVSAGVAAPSEIVAGVPDDLDALCRITLNEGAGPLTPGVVAKRIAPWAHDRVHRAGVDPTVVLRLPGSQHVTGAVPAIDPTTGPAAAASTPRDPPLRVASGSAELAGTAAVAGLNGSAPEPKDPGSAAVPGRAAPAGAAPTRAVETALASTGAAAGAAGDTRGSFATPTGEQSARAGSHQGNERTKLPVGLTPKDDLGPPLPLLPASTALPPSSAQSKMVMVVVAAFVALALFIGYRGLVGLGGGSLGASTPRRTVTVTAPAVIVPASPAPQAAATGAGPIAILSATGFDPEGDQQESNSQAARVFDGNPATTWTTELYRTAQFGNLKKGVGLLLDLGQPTSVHQVTLDLTDGPVDVTVYAATSPSLAGAAVIGTASAATGRVELKATTAMPESQFIIVWFTSLAPHGGQFGASVAEIALN
jgi:hypothetical protein